MVKQYKYHEWRPPLELLQYFDDEPDVVLLLSSLPTSYSGRYSWLAAGLCEVVEIDDINDIPLCNSSDNMGEHPEWFGYMGYETRTSYNGSEKLHNSIYSSNSSTLLENIPTSRWGRYKHILKFDHKEKTITEYSYSNNHSKPIITADKQITDESLLLLNVKADNSSIQSNMSKSEYLNYIDQTIEEIKAGEFYQANITRKFFGNIKNYPTDGIKQAQQGRLLFTKLCDISPAPYSAYIRFADTQIISSSPEMFLKLEPEGKLISRPIKGTKPAQNTAQLLAESEKDKAENLMIVDLVRNDMSRISNAGSVEVNRLYDIDSFSTLHHMSSEIISRISDNTSIKDILNATFPAGSMTGAPKIAAMQHCAAVEKIKRGIYSGAIGWIGKNQLEMSVVIRTIIMKGNKFEFQVGGGIVADSSPDDEHQETITKAKAMCNTLQIPMDIIRQI